MTEPLLQPMQASGYLESVIGDIVPAVLAVVAALVILLVGIIIGRIVGGIVKRAIEGIRPSKYTAGTPLERQGNMDNDVAQAVGDLVKYVIYFLALLLALAQVDLPLPGDVLSGITAAALRIVVAAVILIVGFAIGRFVSGIIEDIVDGFGLETYIRDTPLATVARSVGGVGSAIAMVIEYLIYYFALVAAVDQLQFQALSQPLSVFVGQLPLVIAGVLILVVGIYVADIIGDFVANINATRVTDLAGMVVQLFVYYIVVVFALDTAGFDTSVLLNLFNTVVVAFFGALGVALALAVGIGVGWGSKDYVAENIEDWVGSARNSTSDLTEESNNRSGDNFDSPGSTDD
ncbi:mechanosensitive ion channel family protein [Halococcus salsus]|uniref:mechanosensitive ion channel family protein n=1 Tax=Halococcus salsus TaxID=2162894 RepID=UPI00135AD0A1|nr:phosphatase [Halococcus salsus]